MPSRAVKREAQAKSEARREWRVELPVIRGGPPAEPTEAERTALRLMSRAEGASLRDLMSIRGWGSPGLSLRHLKTMNRRTGLGVTTDDAGRLHVMGLDWERTRELRDGP